MSDPTRSVLLPRAVALAVLGALALGYHDHMDPASAGLQGLLLVGGAQDPGTHY